MCTFIAIASRDLDSVKSMLTGYTIYPAENASLRRLLPENYAWSWLTDGHCACSLHIEPYDVDAEIAKIRSKYSKPKFRKRGWNERRIEDKIAGLKKTRVTDTGGLASGLLDSFFEVVRAKADLHFVINFFSGDQNKETVSVFKEQEIGPKMGIERPGQIKGNILYSFEPVEPEGGDYAQSRDA